MSDILEFCVDLRLIQRTAPEALSTLEAHFALTRLLRYLHHEIERGTPFERWDRRFIAATHDAVKTPRDHELWILRSKGVGARLVEHEGGARCPCCHGAWPGDLSRVGQRCGNYMCPDRVVPTEGAR
jgi:hypothetical protein